MHNCFCCFNRTIFSKQITPGDSIKEETRNDLILAYEEGAKLKQDAAEEQIEAGP